MINMLKNYIIEYKVIIDQVSSIEQAKSEAVDSMREKDKDELMELMKVIELEDIFW